ncbi:MAG: hypothetical protein ACRD3W_23625 [Terriglobales bacterium]
MRERLMSGGKQGHVVLAVCWYTKEQWEKLRCVAVDADDMDDSYEEWLEGITSYLSTFAKAAGTLVTKIEVDVDELQAWCKKRGVPNDSEARSQFAQQRSAELHGPDSK